MNKFKLIVVLILLLTSLIFTQRIVLKEVAKSKIPSSILVPQIGSLIVDNNENVYAYVGKSNVKECFILKFSKDLTYIGKFGRYGKGPGEFTTDFNSVNNRISIDQSNGDIYVSDNNPLRLSVFSNDGKFKNEIPMQREYYSKVGFIGGVKVFAFPKFIGSKYNKKNKSRDIIIFKINPFKIITTFPIVEKGIKVNHKTAWIMGIKESYFGDNVFKVFSKGKLLLANSQKYKIQVFNLDGRVILNMRNDKLKMGVFSKKEIELISSRFPKLKIRMPTLVKKFIMQVKNRKNIIANVKFNGEYIYIFNVRKDITQPNKYPVSIFDLFGKKINSGFLNKVPDYIAGKYAYIIKNNEEADENPTIIKYEIKMTL